MSALNDNYTIHKVSLKRTRQACGPCRYVLFSIISNPDWPLLSEDFLKSEVETYLGYFHDQPYCVFSKSWLLANAGSLPPEIAFPLVALTSRLTHRSDVINNRSVTKYCTGKAWDVLSKQYRDSKMGLSFLQGTFLLAQVDFADGRAQRAYASVALGIRTIQSAGLNREQHALTLKHSEVEETRRITWAFFMLDRSYNASRNYSTCLADKHFTLQLPAKDTEEPDQRQGSPTSERLRLSPRMMGENADQGILTCLIRLHSLWGKATEYVFEPFREDSLPPWQTGSTLGVLESEWLDFETHFPDKYRYINVDFKRRALQDPQSRAYLSTWLSCQFLLHSIQCILHHPFFTMAKLRNMKGNLSATFLQKSYESSLLHSRWIARLAKEMSEVDFQVYDPFLGYLAAIAATIQLEHTVNKKAQVALVVNDEFRVLVDFMTRLSTHWGSTKFLVGRVNEIAARHRNYGSLYYNQDRYSGAHPSMPTTLNIPRMSDEDEALLWEILDLSSFSDPVDMENQALSPSLDQDIGLSDSHPVDQLPISDVQGIDQGSVVLSPSAKQLLAQIPECESEYPMRGWPFAGRNGCDNLGEGIPGIPDWMLLDGYLAESL
ncbi:hypothetical protein N7510_005453 [Penicillium lagena]|uniref:uncharacterized protein n=1 Tax=Penicillium lagena TaxID=94218 RepID=UPI002540BF86|nr:uncharacterized protein N7510_005453 [Penicillium lagena]KAJ5612259.1 hypothetical protein N7510_005453 [Penicillium lagena]